MPGSRAPSQGRTQGALGPVGPGATEDAAWRRVIAGLAPPNLAGRATRLILALLARLKSGHFQGLRGRVPVPPWARGRSGARAGGDGARSGPARPRSRLR